MWRACAKRSVQRFQYRKDHHRVSFSRSQLSNESNDNADSIDGKALTMQIAVEEASRRRSRRESLEERKKMRRALGDLGIPSFDEYIAPHQLRRVPATILQINIGLYCNQSCNHCHVESSPQRTEMMDRRTAERVLQVLDKSPDVDTVDITGGAPELNQQFRFLVEQNGQEDLAEFLAVNRCTVVASLPCYSAKNVNQQRGKGVFDKSIEGLKLLNSVGYGRQDSGLELHLVYNPIGATLPPSQSILHQQYKDELYQHFGIVFNDLFTIANMPIKRFADFLHRPPYNMEQVLYTLFGSWSHYGIEEHFFF